MFVRCVIKTVSVLEADLKAISSNEFLYNLTKDKAQAVLLYKRLLSKYFPNINPYDFRYDEKDFTKINITIDNDEYQLLKAVLKTKKQKPDNNIELLRMIYFLGKHIYGDDIITMTRKSHRDEHNKITKYNIVEFNNETFEKHLELYGVYVKKDPSQLCKIDAYVVNKYYNDVDDI